MVRHATAYSCSRDGEVVFIRYSVHGPSRWFKNLLRRKHRRRGSVRLPHHKTPTPRSIDAPSSRGHVQAVSDSSRRGIGYPKFQLFQKRPNFPKQYVVVRFLLFQLCIENWQFIKPYVSMRRGSVTVWIRHVEIHTSIFPISLLSFLAAVRTLVRSISRSS